MVRRRGVDEVGQKGRRAVHHRYEIVTARLRLHALARDEVRLVLRGERAALGARIGASVPTAWPGPDLADALPVIAGGMAGQPGDERWVWVIVEPRAAALIGDIGFHGPVSGAKEVEMGYVILPEFRAHGYATEAAQALLAWTFAQAGVERVFLRIAHDNMRSLRVAAKLDMRETDSDEPAYRRFERARPAGD